MGEFIGAVDESDQYKCLEECRNVTGCEWFSVNEADSFCGLYSSCEELDTDSCPACISGVL